MERRGLDISSWQGNIDWAKVKEDNIEFAIIRSSYGKTGLDKNFTSNMEGAIKNSIYKGAYHYCYATSIQDAQVEANHFLDVIKNYSFEYPLALDIEESSISSLGVDLVNGIIQTFCEIVENAGYYICVYTNLNWINNYLSPETIRRYDLWIAKWGGPLIYSGDVGIWQYTDEGSVNGIIGNVDLNVSYKDYPSIMSNSGLNNAHSTTPNKQNNPNQPSVENTTSYTVTYGDTLWGIAEKFLGSGNRYIKIVSLNGLTSDMIYPGQVIKIPVNTSSSITTYTVAQGDTLWGIAEKFLGSGNRYIEIVSLNGLTSDMIYPGQVIKIPVNTSSSITTYTVAQGDTLWAIAERFLGSGNRYKEIMSKNGLISDIIYPGQVLKI